MDSKGKRIVLAMGLLCLFACAEKTSPDSSLPSLPSPSSLSLENGYLYWDEVHGAKQYEVKVNGTSFQTNEPVYRIQDELKEGENRVSVSAEGASNYAASPEATASFVGQRLAAPTVSEDPSKLVFSWSEVEGASRYAYRLNEGEWLSCDATRVSLNSYGIYSLQAKALGSYTGSPFSMDSLPSASSSPLRRNPHAASDLTLSKGTLTWKPAMGAESYAALVDGKEAARTEETSAELSSSLFDEGKHTISVVSYAGEANGEEATLSVTATQLSAPTVTYVDDEQGPHFHWDAVEHASGYEVQCGSSAYRNGPSTDFFPEGDGDFSISVSALGELSGASFYSDSPASAPSETKSFLAGPSLRYGSGKKVIFDAMNGADSYTLLCDGEVLKENVSSGEEIDVVGDKLLVTSGIYSLRIRAYQDGKGLSTGPSLSFNTGTIGEREIHNFDDAPNLNDLTTTNATAELDDKIVHGDKGYSLKVVTPGGSTWSYLDFYLPKRIRAAMKDAATLSYWLYLPRPSGYFGDGVHFFGAWNNTSTNGYNDLLYCDGASTDSSLIPFDRWVHITSTFDASRSFQYIDKNSMRLVSYPSEPTYGFGKPLAITSYLDDITFTTHLHPDELFPSYLVSNGSDDPTKTLQTWSFPGLTTSPNTAYDVTVRFRVMQGDGSDIMGAGTWGRRIQWDGSANLGSSYYSLCIGVNGVDPCPVTDESGNHVLPTSSTVMETSFRTATDAEGKFKIYLLDFLSGEILGIESAEAMEVSQ